jgi:hypothetical protein
VILSSGYNEVEAISRFTGKGLTGWKVTWATCRNAPWVSAVGRDERIKEKGSLVSGLMYNRYRSGWQKRKFWLEEEKV